MTHIHTHTHTHTHTQPTFQVLAPADVQVDDPEAPGNCGHAATRDNEILADDDGLNGHGVRPSAKRFNLVVGRRLGERFGPGPKGELIDKATEGDWDPTREAKAGQAGAAGDGEVIDVDLGVPRVLS